MKLFAKRSAISLVKENLDSYFEEYDLDFRDIAVGISFTNGQYPKKGFDVDEQVEQVWYVESGKGSIWVKNTIYKLKRGDMIRIPKGEKFWIKGQKLKLVVSSTPPWYPKQHKHLK